MPPASAMSKAAKAGYHAIGLTYHNDQAIGGLCATSGGTCYGDARLEVLTGQAVSSVVTVDRTHSIEHRLARLLAFMQSTDVAGSWSKFLVGDSTINWSKVSIAGIHGRVAIPELPVAAARRLLP